jgi:aryl-alcohol dehydrogenase-like predicted oxidoreductase
VTIPSAALGRPGTTTTALGFGCSGIVGSNTRSESMGLLSAAVELGIRHFDVARSYGTGDAEAILGDFLTTTNEPCTVTSKCGIAPAATYGLPGRRTKALARAALRKVPGPYRAVRSRATASVQGGQFGPEQIRQSLETSLRALRRDRLEAFLLHECTPEEWASGSIQEVLSDLVRSGAIGCAGPATSAAGTLEILRHESLAVPLVQFQDDGNMFGAELVGLARRRGTSTITHGVLDRNLRALRAHLAGASEPALREWSGRLDGEVTDASVLAALLLRRAMARNRGGVVLFRTNDAGHLRSTVEAVKTDIAADQLQALEELIAQASASPQP